MATTFKKINELDLVTDVTETQEIVIFDTDSSETFRLNTVLLRDYVANTSQDALNVANLSLIIANTANITATLANSTIANALILTINTLDNVNTINTIATTANSTADDARTIAIEAFNTVNIAVHSANGIFANLAISTANTANATANLALIYSTLAYDTANSANSTAISTISLANNASNRSNTANATANSALIIGTDAYNRANTANATANLALSTAISAYTQANSGVTTANSANSWANSQFTGPVYGGFVPKNATISYGMKSDTDNTISLFTGSQSRVFIDASGNVGVGYTSSTEKLSVNGSGYFSTTVYSNYITVNPQTTNYSLELTDSGKLITVNSASNLVVTINSAKNFPVGFRCIVMRLGTGTVSIGNTGSAYWKSRTSSNSIIDQYGSVSVIQTATNQFVLDGNL